MTDDRTKENGDAGTDNGRASPGQGDQAGRATSAPDLGADPGDATQPDVDPDAGTE